MKASLAVAPDRVPVPDGELTEEPDTQPARTLAAPGRTATIRRRSRLVRPALLAADVAGIAFAFLVTQLHGSSSGPTHALGTSPEAPVFLLSLPAWVVLGRLYRLYDRDEERASHSTVDEAAGVFHLATVTIWSSFAVASAVGIANPDALRTSVFWLMTMASVGAARISARWVAQRSVRYLQNAVIIGAGDVGQLIGRKLLNHPEYGINLVGFVDTDSKSFREDLGAVQLLGPPERLRELVSLLEIERVIVAFSDASDHELLALICFLRELDVHIDIVPRLFDVLGPNVDLHSIEGVQLMSLRPVRASRPSLLLKRALDLTVAALVLIAAAPLWAYIAWRIKRDSPGPVLFRQARLGMGMKEFTLFKFRTMRLEARDDEHREYVKSTMDFRALPEAGLYKLQRSDVVTNVGRWLRATSLDELPQLINVLRGEMSLVGPRPCLRYETEHFAPHHFERFLFPAGMTGLWQVKARASATFGEALNMDVAYVRGWSLGLDLKLLCLTPLQLLPRSTR